jgi:hypothetical protein
VINHWSKLETRWSTWADQWDRPVSELAEKKMDFSISRKLILNARTCLIHSKIIRVSKIVKKICIAS